MYPSDTPVVAATFTRWAGMDLVVVGVRFRPLSNLRARVGRSKGSSRSGLPLLDLATVVHRDLLNLSV